MFDLETVFSSWTQFGITALVFFVAEVIYVLFGFGSGLIAVGVLALFFPDIKDVVVLLMLMAIPSEVFVIYRARKDIAWRGVVSICAGLAVGVPLGSLALSYGEPTVVLPVLGGFLVLAGVGFLATEGARTVRWPAWAAPVVGACAGVLAGLFGTGAPPLILYFRLAGANKAVFRAQLMAIFFVISVVRVPIYAATDLITVPRLISTLALLPVAVLGIAVGNKIHVDIAEKTFRRWVSVALAVLGVLLLGRQL